MTAGDIYTIAGSGTPGYSGDGGVATSAELNYPTGLVFDGSGNLLFADTSNHRIRVVAASSATFFGQSMTAGDIYTIAGTGTAGFSGDGGAATSAKLNTPYDVAIDSHGNVVIADKNNQRVRVLAEATGTYYGTSMAAGDIYTVAGNGTASFGGDGGIATSANLNYPKGVALDPNGNIAVDDTLNKRVRVIAGSTNTFYGQSMTVGYIYTIGGTGTAGFSGDGGAATSAELNQPQGITFDGTGNAVIADSNNHRVRVIAATNGTFYGQQMTSGDIYTVAGSGRTGFLEDGVPATYAQLAYPGGVAVDAAGRLVIADTSDNRVRALSGGPSAAALVSPIGGAIGLDLHSPSVPYWSSQQATAGGGSASTTGPQPAAPSQPSAAGNSAPTAPTSGSTPAPVDPAAGDIATTTTDLSLPGAGVPLVFTRTYDSQVAQNEVTNGASGGALGFGWSSSLGMSLSYNSTTHVATVTEENGAQVSFNPYGSQWWCSGAQNFCATAPRTVATLNQNMGGTWTFTRTNGPEEIFTFTSSGALSTIVDAQGDTLTEATYSPGIGQAACPTGDSCIAWTSSASGRELVVATKTSSGQVDQVFDPNNATTEIATFAYSGTGCSTWGGSLVPDLCGVTDPGLAASLYTYDSGNSTAAYNYDMLGATPSGASAQSSISYNSSGLVSQYQDPTGQVTTYSYSGTNSSHAGGTTTVTSYPRGTGSGKSTGVTSDQYSSGVLIAQTNGSGQTTYYYRDPATLVADLTVDGNGDLTSSNPTATGVVLTQTDALGDTTQSSTNGFNQIWCQVSATEYLAGVRCPTSAPSGPPTPGGADPNTGASISFYNSSDQLTATTDPLGNTTTYSYTSGVSGVPNGLLYCSVDPVGYQASVTCPAYGATHVTGTATATYDAAGDQTSQTDADGNTTTRAYSVSGHPGLVSSSTDADGTTTTYTYDTAGEVTQQVASFSSYSATTLYTYDSEGRKYCEVDPYEAAASVTCPSSPPSTPPTPSSDPYLGATITTYDSDGRVIQSTNPLGGITYTAFDDAGEPFCTVAPFEAAASVTCPSSPPTSPPTLSSDPYLGATITTYDSTGRTIQVTNPLGGITLTTYDNAGNVSETQVESNNANKRSDRDHPVRPRRGRPGDVDNRGDRDDAPELRPQRQRVLLHLGEHVLQGLDHLRRDRWGHRQLDRDQRVALGDLDERVRLLGHRRDRNERRSRLPQLHGQDLDDVHRSCPAERARIGSCRHECGGLEPVGLPVPDLAAAMGGHPAEPGPALRDHSELLAGQRRDGQLHQRQR